MDDTEKLVEQYLVNRGCNNIIYEPDGNCPPDFSVETNIGIEVRRLNQHYTIDGKHEGLEKQYFPLVAELNRVIKQFNSKYNGHSFYVYYHFGRPIPKAKQTKKLVSEALDKFLADYDTSAPLTKLAITKNLSINIFKASPKEGRVFIEGGNSDEQRGGWVAEEFINNLTICLDEKLEKIKNYQKGYDKWWLVLVDHVAYGLDKDEKHSLQKQIIKKEGWDKIIIINPLDVNDAIEI